MSERDQQASDDEGPRLVRTWWIVLAVAAIAVVLVATVRLTDDSEAYEVNGFAFTPVACPGAATCWQTDVITNIGVHPITFYYGPRDVEDVLIDPATVQRILNLTQTANASVTVAFDPDVPGEVGLAAVQIARITGERFYRLPTGGGVYGKDVVCEDATLQHGVIYLTQAEMSGVSLRGDCIIVAAPDTEELLRVADAYTLHLLMILP